MDDDLGLAFGVDVHLGVVLGVPVRPAPDVTSQQSVGGSQQSVDGRGMPRRQSVDGHWHHAALC